MILRRVPIPGQNIGAGFIDWQNKLTRGLAFAVNASSSAIDMVRRAQPTEGGSYTRSPSTTGLLISDGAAGYAGGVNISNGITLFSIIRARDASQYLFSDGERTILSARNSSNQGWTWSRTGASAGGAGGNVTRMAFTLNGIAAYTEANSTIESLVDTPVAVRYNKATGVISWFSNGVKSSNDTSGSTGGTAGGGLVVRRQGPYANNLQPFIDKTGLTLVFERVLSDAEIAELSANPWQIFRPQVRSFPLDVAVSGGSASASGGIAELTLTPVAAAGSGASAASGSLSAIALIAPAATASGGTAVPANASGDLVALSLTAPVASGSGSAASSGLLEGISITAPQAVASGGAAVPASASGSLPSVSATSPQASASGAATAAGPMLGINLTPAQAQATAAAWVAAELRAMSLTPPSATAGEPPAIWPENAARAIVPRAGIRAIVNTSATRATVPATGDDMQPIMTAEQYKQDREVYQIDFDAKYLTSTGDTAATLKAVGSDPNITVTPEVSVGGALTSGVVKLAVDDPTAVGDYKVWAQITTAAGRERTGVIVVRVEDL